MSNQENIRHHKERIYDIEKDLIAFNIYDEILSRVPSDEQSVKVIYKMFTDYLICNLDEGNNEHNVILEKFYTYENELLPYNKNRYRDLIESVKWSIKTLNDIKKEYIDHLIKLL